VATIEELKIKKDSSKQPYSKEDVNMDMAHHLLGKIMEKTDQVGQLISVEETGPEIWDGIEYQVKPESESDDWKKIMEHVVKNLHKTMEKW